MAGSDNRDTYVSLFTGRYASSLMKFLFSDNRKFGKLGWRKVWLELARAQKVQGAPISDQQIMEMEKHLGDLIDYERVAVIENALRHDVQAHAAVFGEVCPVAAGIINLAATSCDTTDNVDLDIMREALKLIANAVARIIDRLARFADEKKFLATLGSTHYQAAAITTVGKRACMWMQNFLMDLDELEKMINSMRFRGLKGATGTQASYLALFDGDHEKVLAMERQFTQAFGFKEVFDITGQTYPRKVDSQVLNILSGVAQSVSKMATDMRLLAHDKEVEEPFGKQQRGSTAMAYKRNPMRSERSCSLSRIPLAMSLVASITESIQFLERSLDDSAARRVAISEGFLATDGILQVMQNVSEGLVVYPAVIRKRIDAELPFMAVEEMIVAMVKTGADRQECHENIRVHSQAAADVVKLEGGNNDLLDRIRTDEYFAAIHGKLDSLLNPNDFIGRAPQQVEKFLEEEVKPVLEPYQDVLGGTSVLSV